MEPIPTPSETALRVAEVVEEIVGCKWALSLFEALARGVQRPGALQRSCPGLSTKVMNERLKKMLRFGLIERREFDELPPRVEYELTPLGRRFEPLMAEVRRLQSELER
ncbi:MAG: helix-turn-helix transcriptional regulator [Planctomycetes bacterium]|nr:helix-turn-helix transcriptional regulator [Planctomycetota bacterium]